MRLLPESARRWSVARGMLNVLQLFFALWNETYGRIYRMHIEYWDGNVQ